MSDPETAPRLTVITGGLAPPSPAERVITLQARQRFMTFLRHEILALPSWHFLGAEYRQQLSELEALGSDRS